VRKIVIYSILVAAAYCIAPNAFFTESEPTPRVHHVSLVQPDRATNPSAGRRRKPRRRSAVRASAPKEIEKESKGGRSPVVEAAAEQPVISSDRAYFNKTGCEPPE
jgi:hypothetical protein